MRSSLTVFALGGLLGVLPWFASLSAIPAAVLTIAAMVGAAVLVTGRASAIALATASVAAIASAALGPESPVLAGGVVIALLFLGRNIRARSDALQAAAILLSLVAGAVAAEVSAAYAHAPLGMRAVAVLFSGIIASLPLWIPCDDPIAWALLHYAAALPVESQTVVLRAVSLRRASEVEPESLTRVSRSRLHRAWLALEQTARARLLATGRSATVLDARIASHVDALERAYAAATEWSARSSEIDDSALRDVRVETDTLAAEASAFAEVSDAADRPTARESS